MKALSVPSSNQPVSCIGFSKDFSSPGKIDENISGYVRVKNVSDDIGHIRLYEKYSDDYDDGMAFSAGETEYIYVEEGDFLEVVDGEFNIMW